MLQKSRKFSETKFFLATGFFSWHVVSFRNFRKIENSWKLSKTENFGKLESFPKLKNHQNFHKLKNLRNFQRLKNHVYNAEIEKLLFLINWARFLFALFFEHFAAFRVIGKDLTGDEILLALFERIARYFYQLLVNKRPNGIAPIQSLLYFFLLLFAGLSEV